MGRAALRRGGGELRRTFLVVHCCDGDGDPPTKGSVMKAGRVKKNWSKLPY